MVSEVNGYETRYTFLFFFPLALLEVVLISLYLKKKIKTPLDKIVSGMEELKGGKIGTQIDFKTEAEFQKIVDTFNVMSEELQNEKTQREQLTRKKNQLILELSHDIKTPVATIKSYANALEEGLISEDKVTEVYRLIDAKANRVQKLSEDMFITLKMDNPDYKIKPETTDVAELVRKICAEYYDEIHTAGLEFEIDIPEREFVKEIDSHLFSRVVTNLLSNAARYNQTGSKVAVTLRENQSAIIFEVSDDGEEIEQSFVAELFQPFSRGDRARKTDGGTGLGLAISKIIVEKHGGVISYQREGGMNVFRVEI